MVTYTQNVMNLGLIFILLFSLTLLKLLSIVHY